MKSRPRQPIILPDKLFSAPAKRGGRTEMAFWNRKKLDLVTLASAIAALRRDATNLRGEVDSLHCALDSLRTADRGLNRVQNQSVPTNGASAAGGAVQEWLPVIDRFQELLLVEKGCTDLAQQFGAYARQRELASAERQESEQAEIDGSRYEDI